MIEIEESEGDGNDTRHMKFVIQEKSKKIDEILTKFNSKLAKFDEQKMQLEEFMDEPET